MAKIGGQQAVRADAIGQVLTTGKRIWVDDVGNIRPINDQGQAQRSPILGTLKPDGHLSMDLNGKQIDIDNIFKDNSFVSFTNGESVINPATPLGKPLSDMRTAYAKKSSDSMSWLRQKMDPTLQGLGVHIAQLDQKGFHGDSVTSIIKDKSFGIAPQATVNLQNIPEPDAKPLSDFADSKDGLKQYLGNLSQAQFDLVQKQAEASLAKDPKTKIIDNSLVMNRVYLAKIVSSQLPNTPALRKELLGENEDQLSDTEKFQRILNAVDDAMQNNPQFQAGLKKYQQFTADLAKKNIVMVTPTGNEQDAPVDFPSLKLKSGDAFSFFAMSPSVISVAGSDNNGTPGKFDDDKIVYFSSRGEGQGGFNPTVAAPGDNILVRIKDESDQPQLSLSEGTSYSAPYVAGVIALMLQKHPEMTFEQIKAKLQSTAHAVPNAALADQGSGIIDPLAAVK